MAKVRKITAIWAQGHDYVVGIRGTVKILQMPDAMGGPPLQHQVHQEDGTMIQIFGSCSVKLSAEEEEKPALLVPKESKLIT